MKPLYSLVLAATLACTNQPEQSEPLRLDLSHHDVPEEVLTLANSPGVNPEVDLEENLFGRFYCDRAEFFVIDGPTNKIFDTQVNTIVLYYLDGELGQTRYLMSEDIVSELLETYGKFKITPFDEVNRQIIKSEKIIDKTGAGWALNQKLSNYEIRWVLKDREVKYRVNKKLGKDQFQYLEKIRDFEQEFKELSKQCQIS